MSRAYTKEEVRKMFLDKVRSSVDCWAKTPGRTEKEKLEGLAFTILVLLDGGTDLPSFLVIPSPHESDKEYCEDRNENYFPEPKVPENSCDIAGCLHEKFHR